ncbi:hypothetical protein [Bacillus subtilis]|uniref:hypothetical protein n=1 Tax=Bacillus subtilis TaxID=1423 RepID=UPI001B9D6752|nr:hypothetical protein [Bacillus subtilis]CAF1854330.1 hypothetical protein NRS6145_03989 [Bacillus subtilis]CAI6330020.1 hypothetical protein NRS6145_21150 [Bacillus subtilis]
MKNSYKVGDKAIIIRQFYGHEFEIGEIVTILHDAGHSDFFQASDGKNTWYVSINELYPYELIKKKYRKNLKNTGKIY